MSVANIANRISVEDYERMWETGVLEEGVRIELISGEIVKMSPMNGPHISCLNEVTWTASDQVGRAYIVQIQSAIRIPGQRSAPEPDLAVVHRGYNRAKAPEVADILLVGEVSDTTLSYDRRVRLPLYTRAGIPEVWIFNLVDQRIERYTSPVDGEYGVVAVADRGQRLVSTVLPELVFETDELMLPASFAVEE